MTHPRYAPWVRYFHWLVFVLVACALFLIYLHGWLPRGTALRANAEWAHTQFGIVILLVMLPRLLLRVRSHAPPIAPPPPLWQAWSARLVHIALYLLLFATPVFGFTMMVVKGQPWDFLGIPLPHVTTPDRHFAHSIQDIHTTLGNVLMYLAAAHALIALYHHFVRRDNALRRMLPVRRKGE